MKLSIKYLHKIIKEELQQFTFSKEKLDMMHSLKKEIIDLTTSAVDCILVGEEEINYDQSKLIELQFDVDSSTSNEESFAIVIERLKRTFEQKFDTRNPHHQGITDPYDVQLMYHVNDFDVIISYVSPSVGIPEEFGFNVLIMS